MLRKSSLSDGSCWKFGNATLSGQKTADCSEPPGATVGFPMEIAGVPFPETSATFWGPFRTSRAKKMTRLIRLLRRANCPRMLQRKLMATNRMTTETLGSPQAKPTQVPRMSRYTG